MESLVAANLRSRPTRTFISVLAVALGVILMLVVGGIATGTLEDYLRRTQGLGADFILQASGSSVFYAFSSGTLPIKLTEKLLEVPGVSYVTPVLVKFSSTDFGLIFGIDLATYNQFPGRLRILEGREFREKEDVIVDELYAKSHQLSPGMKVTILNHVFTVAGICRSGAIVRVFVPIETLQEMNGTPDKATVMFLKSAESSEAQTYEELKGRFPNYALVRTSDTTSLLEDAKMPGFKEFSLTVVAVSMLLSFMVILLAMYTTIFERTREIGILKSLGATRGFIVGIILKESVMISCLGVLLGILASALIRKVIIAAFPTLQVSMGVAEVLKACLLALTGGTLGALYPAYKASKQDPVKALSYE